MANKHQIKIAIVVPYYNEIDYIFKMIKSFNKLLKNFPNSKFILIDNGSTDNTSNLLKNKANNNFILLSDKRRGAKFARKSGFLEATQREFDIVISTDADVVLENKSIKKLTNDIVKFYMSRYDVYIAEGMIDKKIYLWRQILFKDFINYKRKIWNLYFNIFGPYCFSGFFLVKVNFLKKILPYFNSETSLIPGEDTLFARRAYFIQGKFFISKSQYIVASARRFLQDPLDWLVSKPRKRIVFNNKLQSIRKLKQIALYVNYNHKIVEKEMTKNATKRFWLYFLDTVFFYINFNQNNIVCYRIINKFIIYFNLKIQLSKLNSPTYLRQIKSEFYKIAKSKINFN